MKSTGEVMGTGKTFASAFAKAQLAAGDAAPTGGTALISVRDVDKPGAIEVARDLHEMGFKLVATAGTASAFEQAGLEVKRVNKVLEGRPHIVDMIKNDEADLIINTTEGRRAIADSAPIRASAESHRVFYTTTLTAAQAICMSLKLEGDRWTTGTALAALEMPPTIHALLAARIEGPPRKMVAQQPGLAAKAGAYIEVTAVYLQALDPVIAWLCLFVHHPVTVHGLPQRIGGKADQGQGQGK